MGVSFDLNDTVVKNGRVLLRGEINVSWRNVVKRNNVVPSGCL